jgi:hypothetical protein
VRYEQKSVRITHACVILFDFLLFIFSTIRKKRRYSQNEEGKKEKENPKHSTLRIVRARNSNARHKKSSSHQKRDHKEEEQSENTITKLLWILARPFPLQKTRRRSED